MINSLDITVGGNGEVIETAKRFVWDEPVVCEQLRVVHMVEKSGRKVPKQDLIPIFGVFGKESRQFLGHYGKKEHLLQNAQLDELISNRLGQLGVRFDRTAKLMSGQYSMAKCELQYKLHGIEFGRENERYQAIITAINSYDKSSEIIIDINAERIACLNGAYLPETTVFSGRHSTGLNGFLTNSLENSLDLSVDQLEAKIRAIENYEITSEQRFWIPRNMFVANGLRFSGLAARRIEAMIAAPTADEVNLAPFLQLYQASMRYFRDLDNGQVPDNKGNKQSKPELARRMGKYVGDVLAALPTTPKFQEQLLKPADESVYDRQHKVSHIIAN